MHLGMRNHFLIRLIIEMRLTKKIFAQDESSLRRLYYRHCVDSSIVIFRATLLSHTRI